jgi:hypothetical protein
MAKNNHIIAILLLYDFSFLFLSKLYYQIISRHFSANSIAASGPFAVIILPDTTTSLSTQNHPLSCIKFFCTSFWFQPVTFCPLKIPLSLKIIGAIHIAHIFLDSFAILR